MERDAYTVGLDANGIVGTGFEIELLQNASQLPSRLLQFVVPARLDRRDGFFAEERLPQLLQSVPNTIDGDRLLNLTDILCSVTNWESVVSLS